jgi:hypothetical protein
MPDARQEVARRLRDSLSAHDPAALTLALSRWRAYQAARRPKVHDPNVFVAALRWIATEEDPAALAQGHAVTLLALTRAAQDIRAALGLTAPVTLIRLTDTPDAPNTPDAPHAPEAPPQANHPSPRAAGVAKTPSEEEGFSGEALDVLVSDPESAARTAQLLRLLRMAQAQGKAQQLLAHPELPPLLRALLEDPALAAQLEARLGL